jgi:hypothetical protein
VLKRLKNSARNCRTFDSVRWVFLKTENSTFLVPGPWRILRPESPHVPGAGFAKAAVLNHSARVRWPPGSDPLPCPATSCALGVRPSPTPLDAETEKGKPS